MKLLVITDSNHRPRMPAIICLAIAMLLSSVSSLLSKQEASGLYHDLFSVNFPNENDGWACGRRGTMLHTSDGGVTWVRQNTGTEFTLAAVHFADRKNGMAVGHEGTILHTSNGGASWERQKSPVDFFLMDVHCLSPSKAVIAAERTHILVTENGGKTWGIGFKDRDFILKALSFSDARHGWAVGEYGFIYHTEDGGTTWIKQAGNYGFSPTTGELVGDKYLFDVTAVNAKEAWAVGIDGYIKRTVDGGQTWEEMVSVGTANKLYLAASDGKGAIFVGGKGVLMASTDQGANWMPLKSVPSIRYGWLYGAARRGANDYVAVGIGGAIYRGGLQDLQQVRY